MKIDSYQDTEDRIVQHIKDFFAENHFKNAVLGISGGLDSAVVAFLLARALGPKHVFGYLLPYGEQDMEDADAIRAILGLDIDNCRINIKPIADVYFESIVASNDLRKGNFQARIRMAILYDQAKKVGGLVVGTSNRTELELGYYTLHGDGACDIEPLSSLYKTQVFEMAEHLSVPEEIIKKKPSAELWEGQTDEGELGDSYEKIDQVLQILETTGVAGLDNGIAQKELDANTVGRVVNRIVGNDFKGHGPFMI